MRVKSNKAFVLIYFTHQEEQEKHQYPVDDIVANFDVKEFLRQQKQSATLDDLLRRCANGEITRLNYTQYIDPSPLPNIYGNLKMHGNTGMLRWLLKTI